MATQTNTGANQTLTVAESQPSLGFSSADIKSMHLGDGGALIISFNDGHMVTVANFGTLAKDSVKLTLQDGQTIDTQALMGTLAQTSIVQINEPAANKIASYDLAAGQKYALGFDLSHDSATVAHKDGALVITFGDHGQIILQNFDTALNNGAQMTYDGNTFATAPDFLKTLQVANVDTTGKNNANNNDQMADAAQKLAGIEPAAGGNGAGGSGHGYGFNSHVDSAALNGINPLGPIGRTDLEFGLPVYPQELALIRNEPTGPTVSVNNGPPGGPGGVAANEPDAVVKENSSVIVPISAHLGANTAANDVLTVTVTGIPGAAVGTFSAPIGTYDAVHGTWTVTLAPGQNLDTAFTFTPKAYSDVDFGAMVATVSQFDPASGTTQTASANFYVTTDAVAEVPGLTVTNASEEAGHTTALPITTKEIDPDGSEHITSVTIAGVPDGATLNHGTFDAATHTWTLTQADLTGLTISTTKAVAGGDYTLTVTSTSTETNLSGKEVDFSDNSASATDTLTLHVTPNSIPVITPPDTLSVAEANLNPTTTVTGTVTANYGADGPGTITGSNTFTSTVTTLTSGGHPVTVTETGNTYTGTANGQTIFTMTVNTNGSYSFTLDGPLDHPNTTNPHDIIGLNFGVTATDSDGDTATGTVTINVIDDAPVAHADSVTFNDATATVGGNVVTGTGEAAGGGDYLSHDGNNHVTSVAFNGTTDTIAAGGSATIDGKDGDLTIHSDGSYTYTLNTPGSANASTDQFTYTLTDNDGDSSAATLTLSAQGSPTITVNHSPPTTDLQTGAEAPDAVVKENGTVMVPITATLGAGTPANDVLTVTVTGIPGAAVGTFSAPTGHYDAAAGTWTVTLAPGQNLDTAFTFTPKQYSDVDFGQMQATVSQYDPASGTTVSATTGFYVTTDAVAEAPGLTAANASEEAGHSTALAITTTEIDPDGSEHITNITVSGLPAGATLNHGTLNADGSYTLTQADLTGLTVSATKATVPGDYTLTVTSTSTETNLSGKEVDFSDNSATSKQTLDLHVSPNGIPVITQTSVTPGGDSVFEANLNPTTAVSDKVLVNYGVDGPSAAGVTLNNHFASTVTNLTSDGHAVTVSETGNTYTGTANGETIFTLAVNGDGTYKFTLDGTLDHPDPTNPHDVIGLNFGITATDSDGDSATGTITVNVVDDAPVAVNDVNDFYTSVGHTNGNVITGANEVAGGADTLSHDNPNDVTAIQYGTTIDTVAAGGSATIDGKYGELVIHSDGSYTYTLFANGAGGAGTTTNDAFTGNAFPTDLKEGQAISTADQADLGVIHSNLAFTGTETVTGTITHDGAGYANVLGAYTIAADGMIEAAKVVDANVTGAADTFTYTTSGTNAEIGYFVLANGANLNANIGKESVSFIYDYGQADQRTATINDAGGKISMVLTDASGHQTVAQGDVYFTTDRGTASALNADNTVHIVSGLTTAGNSSALSIGFEDLPNGGDKDYNDVVFSTTATTTTAAPAGTDQFTYTLTDGDGDSSKATLTFNGENPPTVTITVNGGNPITSDTGTQVADAVVKENHSITIPVTATLSNPSSAAEALTVVISGIPNNVGTVTAANGGVYDATHGTITWTVAPGASLNSSFSFTPTQYSDVDLGNLHVAATATDTVSGTVTASANLYVTTDAVAEAPGLTVTNASEEAGHTTALAITTKEIDPDGSEHITGVTIGGLPTGATLNHGTYDAVNKVWDLTQADLTGLTVTTAKGTAAGNYALSVVATSTETNLSGKEADLTDNSATTTQNLTLHVDANAIPVITAGAALNVYEANLNPTTSASETIVVNYGIDTGAGVTANNTFSASVANLTSDGHAITVTETGNVYTGTANGQTVFTMTIGADGKATFTLDGTLDHPHAGNDAITLNFGATAADTDGDTASTTISVNVIDDVPVAHNDVNSFYTNLGHTSGNVISGAGDSNTGGADTLSHDAPNTITQIQYGTTVDAVAAGGDVKIDGKYGELDIHSDGSYTYTLFANGAGGGTTTANQYTGNAFPTDLKEGQAISTADQADLGIVHSNVAFTGTTTVSGHIVSDGAGYNNTLGAVTIAADGTLQFAAVVDKDVTSATNQTFSYTTSGTNAEVGYFVIANGYTTNNAYAGLDLSKGSMSFVYDYGQADQRAANIADAGAKVSLVYNDGAGHNTVINGPIYFSSDRGAGSTLDPDSLVHTISGTEGNSTLRVGFEDLPNLGDKDYNDVIFDTTATTTTPTPAGTDQFTYTLKDGDGDTSNATLTFNGENSPTITVTVNGGTPVTGTTGAQSPDAVVKENHTITVPVTAVLNNPSSASEALTVVVSGIPGAAVGTVTAANGGVYDAAHGTVTWTLAPGASLNSSLTFTPKAYSDVDFGNLTVTATATDAVSGTVTTSANVYVTTDAVAEAPGLTVTNASEEAGHTTALSITTKEIDPDGSETISGIKVSGLPTGATLNHGVQNADGSWTLSQADLTGLTVTTTKGTTAGNYALTVAATSTETTLSGKEADLTDNSATTTQTLTLHVDANCIPVITAGAALTVYEANLNPTTSASETIVVNYGNDASAGVTANNTFSASVASLTSNGHAITVTEAGNIYTGTANGHTVFTMTIGTDGKATFVLDGTLDHPKAGNDAITLNFGATASDTDGDKASTTISVNVIDDTPTAHNDVNNFAIAAHTATGNVITGTGELTGGADSLSHDNPNDVTSIMFGATSVAVPASGTVTIDGKYGNLTIGADGSYSYTLNAGNTGTASPVHYTGNSFPTDLVETKPISTADQADLGVIHSNLAFNGTTTVSGHVVSDGAGYSNTLGAFTIEADGTMQAVQFVDKDVTSATNQNFTYTTSGENAEVGYFVVANGYNTNNAYSGIDLSKGSLSFVYDYGHADQRTATVNDAGTKISLVYTDASNHTTLLDGPVYYTTDRGASGSLDPDGLVHTISGVNGTDTSTLRIGFEDLPNLGDKDYNDVIFDTQQTTTPPAIATTDTFTYGLTDGDGDTSTATLTFNGTPTATGITLTGSTCSASTLIGGEGNDTLISYGSHDMLYGNGGADTFVFQAVAAASANAPVVKDFNTAEGDRLDLSALLTHYNPLQASIDSFVHATTANGNTTISVNVNGDGNAAHFVAVAVLQGVASANVDDLLAQHHLVA